MAVLPTYALEELVKEPPGSVEQLAGVVGIGDKRARMYGEAILQLLSGNKPT
jgi:hypothetical protein